MLRLTREPVLTYVWLATWSVRLVQASLRLVRFALQATTTIWLPASTPVRLITSLLTCLALVNA